MIAALRGLRARLILLVLLALLPALVIILSGFVEHQRLDRSDASTEALRIARLLARNHARTLESTGHLLALMLRLPAVQDEDSAACRTLFSRALEASSSCANLTLLRPDGSVIAEARPTPRGTVYPLRSLIPRAKGPGFAVSTYAVNPISRKPCLLLADANPTGKARHLLIATVETDAFSPSATLSGLPAGTVLTALDHDGRILARSQDQEKWVGRSATQQPFIQALLHDRKDLKGEAPGVDGIVRLWGFSTVYAGGDEAGFVGIGVPSSAVYADANHALYRSLFLLGFFTVGVLALAWYGSSAILLRRVHDLYELSQRIARGNMAASPIQGSGGDEIGQLAGAMYDMAGAIASRERDLRAIQDALREGEERYRRLFDTNPLPALVYDGETLQFLTVNEAAVRCYGYSLEQFRTMRASDLCVLGRETCERTDCPCTVSNPIAARALRHRRADGSVILVEPVAHDLILGGRSARLVLINEITERVEAERALRESEERFRKVFEDGPFGMLIADLEGRILQANPVLCRMLGYAMEEMLSLTIFQITHPDDLPKEQPIVLRVLRGEALSYTREKRFLRRDGTFEWVNWTLAGFRDDEGQPRFTLGMAEDIGDRKRAEVRLQESVRQLRDLARRLAAVREEERTGIAREVHDELGQTLTGLKMDLSFLRTDISKAVDGEKRPALLHRVEGMVEMIDSTVQTVRRIATELRPAVLDALGLIPAIEWQLQDFERRTQIQTTFHSSLSTVSLGQEASTAVFRIFQEMLTNVLRHSRAGSVTVTMAAQGEMVELRVSDDGIGMTRSEMENLNSLGLLGMRERALVIGGTIEIESSPSEGTTITVRFPRTGKPTGDGIANDGTAGKGAAGDGATGDGATGDGSTGGELPQPAVSLHEPGGDSADLSVADN